MLSKLFIFAVVGAAIAAPLDAVAHPGGLDASGCHTERSTGDYHCHGGGGAASGRPQPAAPPAPLAPPPPGGYYFPYRPVSEDDARRFPSCRRGSVRFGEALDRWPMSLVNLCRAEREDESPIERLFYNDSGLGIFPL